MSKKLSLRSVAVGAIFALASTGLVASPASAETPDVTLSPSMGESFNSILQSGITLESELNPAFDGDDTKRAFMVENPGGATLKLTPREATDFTLNLTTVKSSTDDSGRSDLPAGEDTDGESSGTVTTNAKFIAISFTTTTSAVTSRLEIATTEDEKNVSLKVQHFVDSDGDNKVSTFEPRSEIEDVILYAPGNVSATTTINNLVYSEDTFRASVEYGQDINPFFQDDRTGIRLLRDGETVPLNTVSANDGSGATSSVSDIATVAIADSSQAGDAGDPGYVKNTLSAGVETDDGDFLDATLASKAFNGFYTAVAFYDTDTNGGNFGVARDEKQIRMGSPSRAVDLTAGTNAAAAEITPTVSNGPDQVRTSNGGAELTVRSKTEKATFGAQIEDSGDDPVRASNIEVRATISATALDDETEITVTGSNSTLTSTSGPIVAFARTDSLGQVEFTVTSNTGEKDDNLAVDLAFKDSTGAYVNTGQNDPSFIATNLNILYADAEATVKAKPAEFVSGPNPSVTIAVEDQFGEPLSTLGDERLSVFASAYIGGVEDAATYSERLSVVDGEVEFSFANFAALGSSAELRVQAYIGAETKVSNGDVSVIVYNTAATETINVADNFSTSVTYTDYVVGDSSDPAVAAQLKATGLDVETTNADISGTVVNADGSGQPGTLVTISADGFLFYDDAAGTYALDTITVAGNEFGAFDVEVFAHNVVPAGATVTIEADGVTTTTSLATHLPESPNELTRDNLDFSWNFPETIVMNTTYAITAKLTDKWGNPIASDNLGVKFQGFGSVEINGSETAKDKNFNSSGEVTVFVRSLKDIAGPGSVTAELLDSLDYPIAPDPSTGAAQTQNIGTLVSTSVDLESTAWDETLFDKELSEEVEVYETAADAPQSTSTQKVNAGSFKGYVAVYALGYEGQRLSAKIGNDWVIVDPIVNNESANLARVTDFTGAGVDIQVRIYIDRVLIDTIPLTTK
jgi:hypothetical protein